MAKDTVIIKDKNWRISLSEAIREAENLNIGDIIEIDVKKVSTAKNEETNGRQSK